MERTQASLLDRLTDDQPSNRKDATSAVGISFPTLRAFLVRDLSWLLNTTRLEASIDLEPYPAVAASALNYGVPTLIGQDVEALDGAWLRREITAVLLTFEPRLVPDTLQVLPIDSDGKEPMQSFDFRIEAEVHAQPVPLRIQMRTEFDMETSSIKVIDMRAEGG